MDLSAHVWKFVAACANEEDDMKQTKTIGYILQTGGLVLDIKKFMKVRYNFGGVNWYIRCL